MAKESVEMTSGWTDVDGVVHALNDVQDILGPLLTHCFRTWHTHGLLVGSSVFVTCLACIGQAQHNHALLMQYLQQQEQDRQVLEASRQ